MMFRKTTFHLLHVDSDHSKDFIRTALTQRADLPTRKHRVQISLLPISTIQVSDIILAKYYEYQSGILASDYFLLPLAFLIFE
jgi:hypothetical protein